LNRSSSSWNTLDEFIDSDVELRILRLTGQITIKRVKVAPLPA